MRSTAIQSVAWEREGVPPSMSKKSLETVDAVMVALTSMFFVAHLLAQWQRRKPFEAHDFLCWFSYVSYILMCVMYFQMNVPLFRVEAVLRGQVPEYPELLHDAGIKNRYLTAGQLLFYVTLLSVKLSLLALYHRLLDRAERKFTIIWRTVVTFCIVSFIACLISSILVCGDHKAMYNQGRCNTMSAQRRAQISLWLAYVVDVATDLAVMFLPFRMTWNLRMHRVEKTGIFVLFGTGWICILFATLRVVQVGVRDGVVKAPDVKWLQMWTIIETSMAVIIGCAPAFAAVIRRHMSTRSTSGGYPGYPKRSADPIQLKSVRTIGSGGPGRMKREEEEGWTELDESSEELAYPGASAVAEKHRRNT